MLINLVKFQIVNFINKMTKCSIYIFLSLFIFNLSLAKNIDIQEDIEIGYVCELEKKILKN